MPAIVAIVFAWIAYNSRMRQIDTIDQYREAIHSGHDAGVNSLVNALGSDRARDLIISLEDRSPDVVFDGFNRWVQILRVPNAFGTGLGDGYTLYSLGGESKYTWTLPEGAVLQRVYFDGDEIVFRLHGDILQGSYRYLVPDDKPAEYRLEWGTPGTLPMTDVGTLMASDYCIEKNRWDK